LPVRDRDDDLRVPFGKVSGRNVKDRKWPRRTNPPTLEFFAGGANVGFFAEPTTDTERLLVPRISLIEVFKRVLQ